jgi:hypothetical protein
LGVWAKRRWRQNLVLAKFVPRERENLRQARKDSED